MRLQTLTLPFRLICFVISVSALLTWSAPQAMAADPPDPLEHFIGHVTELTDVTHVSARVLDVASAMAVTTAYLQQAQAQTVLFANAVNAQAQLAVVSSVVATTGLVRLLGPDGEH